MGKEAECCCTIQIVNYGGVGEADSSDNDSYCTLYKKLMESNQEKVITTLFGTHEVSSEDEINDRHKAENLALWFLQVFNWWKTLGADMHPDSAVHNIINKLFWGIEIDDESVKVVEASLLCKFIQLQQSPLFSNTLALSFLIFGDSVSDGYITKIAGSSETLRDRKVEGRK